MIKNMVFPLFAAMVGILTSYLFRSDYLILANAGLSILGFILFISKVSFYRSVLSFWVILQLFVIRWDEPISLPFEWLSSLEEVNFTQTFTFFNEAVRLKIPGADIQFNLITIAYLVIHFLTMGGEVTSKQHGRPNWTSKGYANQTFELKLFRWNQTMENILPQKVKVVKKINFSESKDWLLVSLTKPIKFKNGKVIHRALIKSKDTGSLKRNVKGQMAHFRIVSPNDLKKGRLALKKTTFIDWVFVR